MEPNEYRKYTIIVGLTIEQARAQLKKYNKTLREIERDGDTLIGTADYDENRVNVRARNGKVIEVTSIG